VPALRSTFPAIEVVIAGQGNRPLPAGCRSLGVVTDREKAELLASSDAFVAPHLARESFGIVLLEAMASGAAVVASDLDAFSDLLTGSPDTRPDLGSTFAVGDPVALAAAVRSALERPDSARLAAAAEASRRYDWSVVGSAIAEVYRATRDVARPEDSAVAR
jgi:phosphatidylinositol alpha-mannosyltransferase